MQLSFGEQFGEDLEYDFVRFKELFEEVSNELKILINNSKDFIIESENTVRRNKVIERIEINTKKVNEEFYSFFSSHHKYLNFIVLGRNFNQILIDFLELIRNINLQIQLNLSALGHVLMSLRELVQSFDTLKRIENNESKSKDLISKLELEVEKATQSAKGVESAKLALEGQRTEQIYSQASNIFLSAARNYEVFFYMLIGTALIITVICLAYFPYSEATKVNFIFSKILTATLVITLGTLFLRKAAHLRKLHEQAHQTSLELQALPLYLVNVTPDHQAEIYKDLASKYFGKELDKTQHDKIGDLMTEQVKTSLEVFKTSSEIMKSMKPSVASSESGEAKEKPKN
ncbi:hypothetical protein [Acinetobacter sp. TUM15071]|uniref:hypothetical protein n=1 Tax=Acinetobacter sp. TUM15071 TaxID=2609135 RepID=UPI00124E0B7B|nr:hypothetical protein [Acinetobacter sp. TUM15071]